MLTLQFVELMLCGSCRGGIHASLKATMIVLIFWGKILQFRINPSKEVVDKKGGMNPSPTVTIEVFCHKLSLGFYIIQKTGEPHIMWFACLGV